MNLPRARRSPSLFGPDCSPKLDGRFRNCMRSSSNSSTTAGVGSVHASPMSHASQSVQVWSRRASSAVRRTSARLYVATMTVTAGGEDGAIIAERTHGPGTEQRWVVTRGFALSLAYVSGALALVVLTPRLLSALGPAQFGVWVSLSAAAAVIGLLDPGLTSAPGRLISR